MWSKLRSWMSGLTRRARLERDLADELAFHVETRADDWVRRGLSRDEAVRRARLEFGSVEGVKEGCRQALGLRLLDEARLDVRYALRSLAKTPSFTTVVVILLALGIGANTAMFSLLDAVLWRTLPVRAPGELVFLERFPGRVAGGFKKFSDISYPLMRALHDRDPLLEDATTLRHSELPASIAGRPEPLRVLSVADNFFGLLGVGAAAGRLIQPGDGSGPPAAVLAHGFWLRRYAGRPVLGTSITIGGAPHTIVGVTHPDFLGIIPGSEFDVSIAIPQRDLEAPHGAVSDPQARPLSIVLGRLRPGFSVEDASASLTALLRQLLVVERIPGIDEQRLAAEHIEARSASRGLEGLRRQFSKPLAALMGFVFLVLLLTCVNVANLHFARAAARQREMAVRLSIGAGRARLLRQLLTESLMLAAAGAAAGIVVAQWSLAALLALLGSGMEPFALPVSIDARALSFTAAVAFGAALLSGLLPAWRASGAAPGQLAQRGSDRSLSASMPSRLLVGVQVMLSLVLLAGAGLFVKTFQNLLALDAGYDRGGVLAVGLDPQLAGLAGPRVAQLYAGTLERVASLPGVRSASFERNRPLSGSGSLSGIRPAGYAGADDLFTWFEEVGPRYFGTLGIRLVAGRDFRLEDDAAAPKVIAVNETAARVFFPGQNPIGRRIGHAPSHDQYEIIAVAADVRHVSLREPSKVMVYLPALQDPDIRSTSILVRTSGDPLGLADHVRRIVREIEPAVPVMSVTTLGAVAARSLRTERLAAALAGAFGVLSLILAGVGLSGILLFGVARRTREIGVRMALGATNRQVISTIVRDAVLVVGIGIAAGLPCAIVMGRLVTSMLFGLSPSDPWTLGASVATLVAAGVLASTWPARRAAAVNPIVALRSE